MITGCLWKPESRYYMSISHPFWWHFFRVFIRAKDPTNVEDIFFEHFVRKKMSDFFFQTYTYLVFFWNYIVVPDLMIWIIFIYHLICGPSPPPLLITMQCMYSGARDQPCFNPLMPVGIYSYQFLIFCPRDAVSRTANVERTGWH